MPPDRLTRAGWGATALAAAVVAQWLLHQAWPTAFFPPHALGDAIIRETPGDFATQAIESLGHFARQGLVLAVIVAMFAAGGAAAAIRPRMSVPAAAAMTILAAVVAPIEPSVAGAAAAVMAAAIATALAVLLFESIGAGKQYGAATRNRRLLLAGFAGGFVLLASGAVLGRTTREAPGDRLLGAKRLVIEPDPAFPDVPGLSARITAPEDHYQVDIDLTRPRIDGDSWRLEIGGEVGRARTFTFDELAALGAEERSVFLQCVSNVFAGDLMSNSTWTCVPLAKVLAEAQSSDSARYVVARAVDGYRERYPLEHAAEIYVALGMGDGPVLPDHGYPVRLLVPGHYGVRSVKWLTSLELVGETVESYWEERGWDADAVMNTGARIDTPAGGDRLNSPLAVAGVAWGPGPVSNVEVSLNGGESWQEAQLEALTGEMAWTRWQITMDATPGEHVLAARAVAGGEEQILEPRPPHPSGATGLQRVTIRVV